MMNRGEEVVDGNEGKRKRETDARNGEEGRKKRVFQTQKCPKRTKVV
jgi:hypothetical protein